MRKTMAALLSLAFFAGAACAAEINFAATYDAALPAAAANSQDILITFYADW